MKISKATLATLRNFSGINENIYINAGNILNTRTVAKSIYAEAEVDTNFPISFGIYDLGSLLGTLSLFSDPDVEFGQNSLTISQGKNRANYIYATPEILHYPEKRIALPSVDASFELSEETLKAIIKAGSVLSSTDIKVSGKDGTITCTTLDPKNVSANTFSVDVGSTDKEFDVFIKLENMKMPLGIYRVDLSSKKLASFTSIVQEPKTTSYMMIASCSKGTEWK